MPAIRSRAAVLAAGALLAAALAGCASDTAPDADVGPIVTITNRWQDVAVPGHQFQFNSDQDGEVAGVIVGEEFLPGGGTFPLAGTWALGVIEFTVARPQPVTYRTTEFVNDPDLITFRAGGDKLTLRRGG